MKDVEELELKKDELTIVDECDRLYYGDTLGDRLPTISGDGFLLGLSATGLSDQIHELSYIINDLKMRCFRSNWVSHDSLTQETEVDSFEKFLDKARDDAMLVHCEEKALDEYEQIATGRSLTVHRNVSNLTSLRNMKPSECYFVTHKRLMRGFDYRGADRAALTTVTEPGVSSSARNKLSLLMACPADTRRDYLQALGRVGRFGDACARYRLRGVDQVNAEESCRRGALMMARRRAGTSRPGSRGSNKATSQQQRQQ